MKIKRIFAYPLVLLLCFTAADAGPFDVKQALPAESKSVHKLIMSKKSDGMPVGTCTGWVGENHEGEKRIVTNSHCCIDDGNTASPEVGELTNVKLADGRALKRFIFDPFADICVLSIEGDSTADVPLHLATAPTYIMDRVTVVGYPRGRPLEAYAGYRVDSALIPIGMFDMEMVLMYGEANWCIPLPDAMNCMYLRQSDTYRIKIEPGNSGSPLLNDKGEVVALVWGMSTFNDTTLTASLEQLKRYVK